MSVLRPLRQPRGLCPVCRREMALLEDHTVARHHLDNSGRPCTGYGLEGQILPVGPERIRVTINRASRRATVWVGGRLVRSGVSWEVAMERADLIAAAQRQKARRP